MLTDDRLHEFVMQWRTERKVGWFGIIWRDQQSVIHENAEKYLRSRIAQEEKVTWLDIEADAIERVMLACDHYEPTHPARFRVLLQLELKTLGRAVWSIANKRRVARGLAKIPESQWSLYETERDN